MPLTEAQKRAQEKYSAKTYKVLRIKPKIEEAERITNHAKQRDESLTRFLVRAAEAQMQQDNNESKE